MTATANAFLMALSDFVWSSYPLYLAVPSHRPDWLRVQRLLAEWRIPQDSEAGRRAFARAMEQRRRKELEEEFLRVERAWYLGDDEFRQARRRNQYDNTDPEEGIEQSMH